MKTKEELNALKAEVEALNKKLANLNDEELTQIVGGLGSVIPFDPIHCQPKTIDDPGTGAGSSIPFDPIHCPPKGEVDPKTGEVVPLRKP